MSAADRFDLDRQDSKLIHPAALLVEMNA